MRDHTPYVPVYESLPLPPAVPQQDLHENLAEFLRYLRIHFKLKSAHHNQTLNDENKTQAEHSDFPCFLLKRSATSALPPQKDAHSDTDPNRIPSSSPHSALESVLALDPFEVLQIQNKNPFAILSQAIARYRIDQESPLESFFGASLGYVSYDAVRHLEPILIQNPSSYFHRHSAAQPQSSVKAYDAEFMFFRQRVVIDHRAKRIIFASGFIDDSNNYHEKLAKAQEEIRVLSSHYFDFVSSMARAKSPSPTELSPENLKTELPLNAFQASMGRERFFEGVKKLKKHIRDGDIFQAVLADQFQKPFRHDPLELFQVLQSINPSPYEFYFCTGQRYFLGASPEMLLKSQQGQLETHPIAGTRPRGKTAAEEKKLAQQLLRSVKEKAEHLMLVDLARNDIGRISQPGSVTVKDFMGLKKFGSVMHLVSRVFGRLDPRSSAVDALASCFPAGTLSGAPKIKAMDLLSQIERAPRGFYGGAVVAASLNGDLDSCIAIRSVRIENQTVFVQAGAGIVADSQADREYQEVEHKTRMVRRALGILENKAESSGQI